MQGLIYKSTGNRYLIKTEDARFLYARLKGKIKMEGITSTNPIAVGDWVELENDWDEENVMITEILERRNYINRVSPHNKHQQHIVASNLDQSLLFATIKEPKTSQGFIDRFLVTCEAYHVPAIIVFNKIDLLKEKELAKLDHLEQVYRNIGYTTVRLSMKLKIGVEELINLLKDKTTLISGHSGVGKSTFINYLFPEVQQKTTEVSEWSGKGMHTTTFAEMFDLPLGGSIIDTPGIREMGIVDIERTELSHYFPEMRKLLLDCKFNNCLHINEPDCAIKNAVNNDGIDVERYTSYLNIFDSLAENNY